MSVFRKLDCFSLVVCSNTTLLKLQTVLFLFFPNSTLQNKGCGWSMDAAYRRTFTVQVFSTTATAKTFYYEYYLLFAHFFTKVFVFLGCQQRFLLNIGKVASRVSSFSKTRQWNAEPLLYFSISERFLAKSFEKVMCLNSDMTHVWKPWKWMRGQQNSTVT